jgi:hypothetical protein
MVAVLPLGLVILADTAAQAATQASPDLSRSQSSSGPPAPVPSCGTPSTDGRVIVVCTQRPQGYRLNPDVMEARREMKSHSPPPRPGGKVIPDCQTVGPQPCVMPGINLIGAALTAGEMAERLAKGEEVGSMFVTDPHPSEYQLYQMAKERREAEEAQKAADIKAKARAAAAQAAQPPQSPPPSGN